MSSENAQPTLADICVDVSYGYTESASSEEIGPKFLRITDIQGGTFDWDKVPFCPASPQDVQKYRLEVGDIVIARTGNSTGENAQVFSPPPPAVFASYLIRFRPDIKRVNPFFVGYQLRTERFRQHVLSVRGGSAQPGANAKQLGSFPVQLINRAQQDAVVSALRVLDDRITLLRETNATLEAIAQALFKSWFVDFDPVRAKMAGRAPEGMDEATAALFPDALEETESGVVPKGWVYQSISDVVEGVYDGPHATPPEADSGGVFLGIKNLTGTALDLSEIRFIGDAEWAKWTKRVEPRAGDIVFTYEATLGFFALIPPDLRCCLGRRLALIRPKEKNGAGHFWFHQFVAQPFQALLAKHTIQGATVNRIALKEFPAYSALVPPLALQVAFDHVAASLWSRIHANQAQALALAQLRDTLLPRLISGQLILA